MEKKLPKVLATLLDRPVVRGRKVRLMFQDEARFGRMVRIRRCWAPQPARPVVCNGYEREFVYVYGAVSPIEGQLDWMITRQMNTEHMSAFLAQVSTAHSEEFLIMVVDGASSHVCKDLIVPENMRLVQLPPYAPELNPQEHVWDELSTPHAAVSSQAPRTDCLPRRSHLSSPASGSSDIPVRLSPHAKPSSSAFHRLLPLPSCSSIAHHTISWRSNS